jgi:hypothetical protein
MDHGDDGRLRPHITAQVARHEIPLAEQEVGRPDQECEREEPEGDIAGGGGKPRHEQPVLEPVKICALVPAVVHRGSRTGCLQWAMLAGSLAQFCATISTSGMRTDTYGLGNLSLAEPGALRPVTVEGIVHEGVAAMERLEWLRDKRFLVGCNVDGCSWVYEGKLAHDRLVMALERVLVGQERFANGVLQSIRCDKVGGRFAVSFSTASPPTQIYIITGPQREYVAQHTRARVLGALADCLSPGEDASFISFDGLRISARLYMAAASLGLQGPRSPVH